MGEIDITKSLSGSLSETYFKEKCDQEGFAYISLEQIPLQFIFNLPNFFVWGI